MIESDETTQMLETLNKLTHELEDVFIALENQDPSMIFTEMKNFLISLTPFGICACLGMRKTHSS